MSKTLLHKIISKLGRKGIIFNQGLSNQETQRVQEKFEFNFPEDLIELLQIKLPISDGFVNWRLALSSDNAALDIIQRLNWPVEGLLHSIENGFYWCEKWGDKPVDFEEQRIIVETAFLNYPKLIPIYSHRYIPEMPNEKGNPIFSVHQCDTIYYGNDLIHYFENEFNFTIPWRYGETPKPKRIHFWGELVDRNHEITLVSKKMKLSKK